METMEMDLETIPDSALVSLLDEIEAEAAAKSTKRQKTATEKEEEGSYMAALRGSRSSLWQQQQVIARHTKNYNNINTAAAAAAGGGGGGGCFKCGMGGHWARDCTGKKEGPLLGAADGDVAEKLCPCGNGTCLVLTSNTPKNPGRKFYRCPIREGMGSCGYFKWCDEPGSVSFQPTLSLQTRGTYNSSTGQISAERNGSSCFKCGEGGHWAKDCTKPTSDRYADVGGNRTASSGSGSCFKCGEAGHWARDCNAQDSRTNNTSQKAPHFRTFSNKY